MWRERGSPTRQIGIHAGKIGRSAYNSHQSGLVKRTIDEQIIAIQHIITATATEHIATVAANQCVGKRTTAEIFNIRVAVTRCNTRYPTVQRQRSDDAGTS